MSGTWDEAAGRILRRVAQEREYPTEVRALANEIADRMDAHVLSPARVHEFLSHLDANDRATFNALMRHQASELVNAARPLINLCRAWFDGTDLKIYRASQHEDEPTIGDLIRDAARALDAYDAASRAPGGEGT